MNRYYWFSIALFVLGAICITAIWCIDLSDSYLEKQIDLTLKIIGAAGAISGVVFASIGATKQQPIKPQPVPTFPPSMSFGTTLTLEESTATYLANLEIIVTDRSPSSKFIELSTEVQPQSGETDIELLQDFQWSRKEFTDSPALPIREPVNFLEAHIRFPRYVLLGDPGSGKTTCLNYLTLSLIQQYRNHTSTFIPLYVSLSRWQDSRIDALTFLKDSFSSIAGPHSALTQQFESRLSTGQMIVILDGLNEMPGRRFSSSDGKADLTSRRALIQDLSSGRKFRSRQDPRERSLRELAMLNAVRSHFIVSCRTHEFFQSPSWQEVYVLPMNEEQILKFIGKYLPPADAIDLRSYIGNMPALKELARNPFFLRSMTRVPSNTFVSVQNRGQFLDRLYEQLLRRESSRGIIFNHRRVTKTMACLAYKMMRKDMIGSQVDLSAMAGRRRSDLSVLLGTGLVNQRQDGAITFYHQLVQEYFVASRLRDKWPRPRLVALLHKKKWSEAIVLWNEISKTPSVVTGKLLRSLDARNCLWLKPRSVPWLFIAYDVLLWNTYAFLFIAVLCDVITGGTLILPLLVAHPALFALYGFVVPFIFHRVCSLCFFNRDVIGNAAYVLGELRNPVAIDLLISAFKHAPGMMSASLRKAIAQALGRYGGQIVHRLIAELSSKDVSIRAGCICALGLIGDNRAVDPLLAVLREGRLDLLHETAEALRSIGDPKAGPEIASALKTLESVSLFKLPMAIAPVNATLRECRQFDQSVFDKLSQLTEKGNPGKLRIFAVQALGAYGHAAAVPLLAKIARDADEDARLRDSTVHALSFIIGPDGVRMLLELCDDVPEVRPAAINALGAIRTPETLPALHEALTNSDPAVRRAAVQSIGLVGEDTSVTHLRGLLDEHDSIMREQIALALGRIGAIEAIDILKDLCWDKSGDVRTAAMQSLDFTFPEVAKDFLLGLACDHAYPEREKAIELLAQYRFSEVRQTLLALCADPNETVKREATESLRCVDRSLEQELKYISYSRKGTFGEKLFAMLIKKLEIHDLQRLMREERLKGATDQEAMQMTMNRVMMDPEMSRHFRRVRRLAEGFFLFLFLALPGIVIAFFTVVVPVIGRTIWAVKWIAIPVLAIGAVTFIPGIRNGRGIRVLGIVFFIIRTIAILIALAWFCALVVKYWWASVPLVVLLILGATIFFRMRLQKGH